VEPLDRRARSSGERMRPYEGVQGALSAETVGGDDGGSQHRRELQLRAPTLRPIRRLLDGLKLAFTIGQSHVVGGTTTERSIRPCRRAASTDPSSVSMDAVALSSRPPTERMASTIGWYRGPESSSKRVAGATSALQLFWPARCRTTWRWRTGRLCRPVPSSPI